MPVRPHEYPAVVAALRLYSRLGWKIFPAHYIRELDEFSVACSCEAGHRCANMGKHPRVAGYAEWATSSLGDLLHYWFSLTKAPDPAPANVGVISGKASGFLVYDADLYKPEGAASHANLVAARGEFPKTVTSQSGSGKGRHLFFAWDPRLNGIAPRMYKPWPGIEVFCGGTAFVILPPSRHKSGGTYTWIYPPETTALAPAPEWLVQHLLAEHDTALNYSAQRKAKLEARTWFEKGPREQELDAAFDRYRARNTPDWPKGNSECPVCRNPNGFKRSKHSPELWVCHGGRHETSKVGRIASDGSWCGDVVDIHAYEKGVYDPENRNRSRVALLKIEGYVV